MEDQTATNSETETEAATAGNETGLATTRTLSPGGSDRNSEHDDDDKDAAIAGLSSPQDDPAVVPPTLPSPPPPPGADDGLSARTVSVSSDDEGVTRATSSSSSSPPPPSCQYHRRLRECLSDDVVDLSRLRKLAAVGLPDEDEPDYDDDDDDDADATEAAYADSYRGLTWRLLLGFLPPERADWDAVLAEKRGLYRSFVADWFQIQNARDSTPEGGDELRRNLHSPRRQRQRQRRKQNNNSGSGDGENPEASEQLEGSESHSSESTEDHSSSSHNENNETGQSRLAADEPPIVVPPFIREMWHNQGRDWHVLEGLLAPRRGTQEVNALRWDHDHVERLVVQQRAQIQGKDDETNHVEGTNAEEEKEDSSLQDLLDSAVLLDEIRKDVVRTHPDFAFFLHPAIGARRYSVLERILFCWSKYNRGVRYVQGMNEIVATLYYVLATDSCAAWAVHAEADTYWLLHTVLTEMQDVFVADLDEADTGIQGRIANMQELLQQHDPEVKEHLEETGIDASFYAIRWWTTLLSREFMLPDTIRLWDSMFASTHKDNFLRYVCVTMVLLIRSDLLKGDFSTCLKLLQSYPPTHMDRMLESSRALWIYESQIAVACHKGGVSLHQAIQIFPPPPALVMAFGLRNKNGSLVSLEGEEDPSTATNRERLEQAGAKASVKVRGATQAAATSASVLFGRARGLYSKYSQEYSKRQASARSSATDSSNHSSVAGADAAGQSSELKEESDPRAVGNTAPKDAPIPLSTDRSATEKDSVSSEEISPVDLPSDDPDDSVYLEAFLNLNTGP